MKNRKPVTTAFFASFLLAYVALTYVSLCLTDSIWGFVHPLFLIILCIFNIPLAFLIVQNLLSIVLGPDDPPRLPSLTSRPRIAVVYTTCDDVDRKCLLNLRNQTYESIDTYVLDDSERTEYRSIIDEFSSVYTIIRRECRKGKKAGNLNNWLRLHGASYPFFVILDNDSIIGPDFVETMLRYAMHPENARTAAFQSLIEIWNRGSPLSDAVNCEKRKGNRIACALFNRLRFYFGWGHNVMYRTAAVLDVGRFNESFVGEDIELGLRLMEHDYDLKIVDILSYEGINDDILRYSVREGRICQSDLQVLLARKWSIPFESYFFLLILNLRSLSILVTMALNALVFFDAILVRFGPIFASMSLDYYSARYLQLNVCLFLMYFLIPVFFDVAFTRPGHDWVVAIINKFRLLAYNLSVSVFLFSRIVAYLVSGKVRFHVTNDRRQPRTGLLLTYQVSLVFYILFPLSILVLSRKLFLLYSIWFLPFFVLSAMSLHLWFDSVRRVRV